jgi:large subunit ribosomal protein L29
MKDKFNDLGYDELKAKYREFSLAYRKVRFDKVLAHVDNPLMLRTLRRKLARLNTIIHEYDTGIRTRA